MFRKMTSTGVPNLIENQMRVISLKHTWSTKRLIEIDVSIQKSTYLPCS